eukprot:Hpha_TRINITY_DN15959_c1_g1::TRINITY_DN15959_c1_g1_i1::g.70582::m.70582/K01908/prpE; propionyl-CoA synthetase
MLRVVLAARSVLRAAPLRSAARWGHRPTADLCHMTRKEYDVLHKKSVDPATREQFWSEVAEELVWSKKWDKVLTEHDDVTDPPLWQWFPGGELNTCYNCVDRHVEDGLGSKVAIYYDSPVTGTKDVITYNELKAQVEKVAGLLASLGVKKGDRVVIYMPMIPEALYSMLACARIGAIHSVVFGGFAAHELAVRIDDAHPTVILAASCGIEPRGPVAYKPLIDGALEMAEHKPKAVVIKQRDQCRADMKDGDLDWDASVAAATPHGCVPVESNDPLYILYTSGTTGKPKGVARENGGHAVAMKWWMEHFHHITSDDTYFSGSDVGWVVGHSCIVYGPLIQGASTVLFEGKPIGTPDAGTYWRLIEEYRVSSMFVAPTSLRAVRQKDPQLQELKNYDTSSLRRLLMAGERCDPDTNIFFSKHLKTPLVDNWWQTETGWSICGIIIDGVGNKPGSTGLPLVGVDCIVVDEHSHEPLRKPGQVGNLMVPLPLPPAWFTTLWNNPTKYAEVLEYKIDGRRVYESGDSGFIDEDGYVTILERADDVMNVAGHRLSPGAIEAVLKANPAVADGACFSAFHAVKGQIPVALLVLNDGQDNSAAAVEKLISELKQEVRTEIGAISSVAEMRIVSELPKTISGKVLRKNLRKIAHAMAGDGDRAPVPSTILNREALDICEEAIADMVKVISA